MAGRRDQQQCPVCFKWLSRRTHLPSHIRDQHSGTPAYEHRCDLCNKYYKTKNALANHKSIQHRNFNIIRSNATHHNISTSSNHHLQFHPPTIQQQQQQFVEEDVVIDEEIEVISNNV